MGIACEASTLVRALDEGPLCVLAFMAVTLEGGFTTIRPRYAIILATGAIAVLPLLPEPIRPAKLPQKRADQSKRAKAIIARMCLPGGCPIGAAHGGSACAKPSNSTLWSAAAYRGPSWHGMWQA